MSDEINETLRNMPQISELLEYGDIPKYKNCLTSGRITKIIRQSAEKTRKRIIGGEVKGERPQLTERIARNAVKMLDEEISERGRRVINGTGIIIHTNIGRAPISEAALKKAAELSHGYSNLEYSCDEGKRRSRLFFVEKLLTDLTGAEAALVTNNNAAAVFLALNTLCRNKNVILSRGEIVEIGDSFRILEIIRESGALITEVGSTNRTYIEDFESAVDENTGILLKMHTSNFKVVGFAQNVEAAELTRLGAEYKIPVMEDMGSGVLIDLCEFSREMKHERTVQEAFADGVDIITFSGDKMLGGPQAGIIAGKRVYIDKMRKNQLMRCLRIDKIRLALLEATLTHYLGKDGILELPVYKMIAEEVSAVSERANRLKDLLENPKLKIEVRPHDAQVGGGSMPENAIASSAVYISSEYITAGTMDCFLRRSPVPVIGTIQNGEYILDLRTIAEEDFDYLGKLFGEMLE